MPKVEKCAARKLELIGKAKLVKANEIGFVERKGRSRILRGEGHVEVFFFQKEDRSSIQYSKRVFLAKYAEYLG